MAQAVGADTLVGQAVQVVLLLAVASGGEEGDQGI